MRTVHYSDVLTDVAAYMGKVSSALTTDELALINAFFNHAMRYIWDSSNWFDVCYIGEARFPNSDVTNPVDLTATSWTKNATTISESAVRNPLDSRLTADKIVEAATTAAHSISQTHTFYPGIDYKTQAYLCKAGRNYGYISVNDGVNTCVAHFNLATGVLVSQSNCVASIGPYTNGWYKCTIEFTSDASAAAGTITIGATDDGATLSYAGNTSNGIYAWGITQVQADYNSQYYTQIPFDQEDETEMEAVFEVWKDNPALSTRFPSRQPNYIVGSTVQLTCNATGDAVYVDYRRKRPDYAGADFSAVATYTAGTIVLYTHTGGWKDYYECLATTTAGQDPEDTPTKWSILEIPAGMAEYSAHSVFADMLRSDGQMEKAEKMEALAEEVMMNQFDVQERQMGGAQRTRFNTHVNYRS